MNTRHAQNGLQPVSPKQIKIIHTLKGVLGMDEDIYRAMLRSFAGVDSSKALTFRQAGDLIKDLKHKAGQDTQQQSRATRHNDLEGRSGMATPPQLRMIEAIWSEVSRAEDAESRAKALRSFLEHVARVSGLRFLDKGGAAKVINALEAMKKRRQ